MKKRFTAFLTALLCMTGTVLSLPVSAEFRIENGVLVGDIGDDINEGLTMPDEDDYRVESDEYVRPESGYSYTTDTFTYTPHKVRGFLLKSEMVDPDYMVVSRKYLNDELYGYVVTSVNELAGNFLGVFSQKTIQNALGDIELQIGDFLSLDGEVVSTLTYPSNYQLAEGATLSYLGNGIDILGKEFEKVIHMELIMDQEAYEYEKQYLGSKFEIDLVKGDVNIDDELSVLDCLAINRNLLIGEPLCDYAKLAGDINENGMIDAVDSLSILKECINITENFE